MLINDNYVKAKVSHDWIPYLNRMRESYQNKIRTRTLTADGVKAYIKHIPINNIHEGWPAEVYNYSEMMIEELYDYCIVMEFIPETLSRQDWVSKYCR